MNDTFNQLWNVAIDFEMNISNKIVIQTVFLFKFEKKLIGLS